MVKNQNFKLIAVLFLSLFLIACGGGKKDSDQVPPDQVTVKTAGLNLAKVSIDLNQNNSADVVLTRIFDDESETTLNLVISWDDENLVLNDESGNLIQLDYDKDLLIAGETSIKFTDPESKLDIEFLIELIQESIPPSIQQYVLSPNNLELEIGNTADLSISVTMSDGNNSTVPEDVICALDASSAVINVSEDCQISALEAGQAIVTLAATEDIDDNLIQKATVVVLPPSVAVITKAEIQAPTDLLVEGLDLQLSVKSTYSNGDFSFDEFDVVKCLSNSSIITITADCKVTAKSPGKATIELEKLINADIELATFEIEVTPRSVIRLRVTPDKLFLGNSESRSVKVLADYNNGDMSVDVTAQSRCFLKNPVDDVISVQESCFVEAIQDGNAEVSAELKDGSIVNDISVASVNVSVVPPDITKIEIDPSVKQIFTNSSLQLSVNLIYSNGEVVKDDFTQVKCISNSPFVDVTPSCNVTANSTGTAIIQLELLVESTAELFESQIEVQAASITHLTVSPINLVVKDGETQSLTILADYNNGDKNMDVTNQSRCLLHAGAGVVSVLDSCEFTALSTGNAKITAELIDGSPIDSVTVSQVEVLPPDITKVKFDGHQSTLVEGLELSLPLSVYYSNGDVKKNEFTVVNCISESEFLSITPTCDVTAISSGVASIGLKLLVDGTPTLIETKIEIIPPDIIKVEIDTHDSTLVEGLELSLPLSVYYSNGVVKQNEFTVVKCISESVFISITPSCNVTAISAGDASIGLELLVDGTPTLIGSQIEIIPLTIKQFKVTPASPRLSIGDIRLLKVIADYNNDTSVDVTEKSSCSISAGNNIISLSSSCGIEALQNGSAEISVSVNDTTVIDPVVVHVTVSDDLVLDSGEFILLDADYFGGDANTRVSCDQDYLLGIESNCEIFAYFPGEHEITATLKNITTGEFIRTVKRTVVVKAVSLGDFSQKSDFSFLVSPNIYAIVFEISNVTMDNVYKITLSDNLLPSNIKLGVLSDLSTSKLACANTVPAASFEGRVACGIRATTDKIYISLEELNVNQGLSGVISIVPDADILQFAGPLKVGGGSNVAYIDAYEFAPLTVGQTFVGGHVPANLEGLNVSRYFSNLELGMNPAPNAGNFYTVTVTFEPANAVGLANFDLQSVRVRWYGGNKEGDPDLQCVPQYDAVKTNTLSCTFNNIGQDNIFVEVHGNGVDNLGLSNVTAVDGEITYSINLSQIP